jgi:enoyl-CoA hydratase
MSAGHIELLQAGADGVARVRIRNPAKHNALSVAMWQQLRAAFQQLQRADQRTRVVLVCGEGGHFAAGGDIGEFPHFRFDAQRLHDFHEATVAPALQAMLDCDTPLLAMIEGSCIGGGLEIAACCDLRIAARSARLGIPIARLGFPLAPSEAQIVARAIGLPLLRELLLEARLLDADAALARGIVHRVVADAELQAQAAASAARIASLSPQAQRINKRTLRQLAAGGPSPAERDAHFAYADSAEHREGLAAFIEKRVARF